MSLRCHDFADRQTYRTSSARCKKMGTKVYKTCYINGLSLIESTRRNIISSQTKPDTQKGLRTSLMRLDTTSHSKFETYHDINAPQPGLKLKLPDPEKDGIPMCLPCITELMNVRCFIFQNKSVYEVTLSEFSEYIFVAILILSGVFNCRQLIMPTVKM